jgi:hypothetical protein
MVKLYYLIKYKLLYLRKRDIEIFPENIIPGK